jgi:hypothetical protein
MSEREKRDGSVNTDGGAYVGGHVDTGGGKFVGRDDLSRVGEPTGVTVQEFVALIHEIRAQLPQAGLPEDAVDAVEGDFEIVEQQAQKKEPEGALIVPRLKSAADALKALAAAGTAAQSLVPMVRQAVEWAQQLF